MGYTEWEFTLLDREFARLDDLRRERLARDAAAKAAELAEDDKREFPEPLLDPRED